MVDDSNVDTNFSHKLFLTNTQVSKLDKVFANNYSANIELSGTQLHKIAQSGELLDSFLEPLLKTVLRLRKYVPKPLPKSVIIPLLLTAAASAADAAIYKKMFGSGTTTLISSNEEVNDIKKIVKPLDESGLLIKGVSETIKENKKEDF